MELGVLWVILIAIATFVFGFFFSRANGANTDAGKLGSKVDGAWDKAGETIEKVKEEVSDKVDEIKSEIDELKKKIEELLNK